ncbi:MAG: hypothetical protein IJR67_04875 [Acholeplasmatales bacterium]|nr:hypothetical protein [Acholeplasmatales bacterium]
MKKKKTEKNDIDFENGVYKSDWLSKIPSWVVIIFLKYWAAAAAVFFVTIGGLDIGIDYSKLDDSTPAGIIGTNLITVVLVSLALALLFNYAVKQLVFLLHNRLNNTYIFYAINLKGFVAFVVHLLYMFLVMIVIYFIVIWFGYNGWILNLLGTSNFGLEPFSFGLFFLIVDGVVVIIKDLCVLLHLRLKYKKQMKNPTPIIKEATPVKEN